MLKWLFTCKLKNTKELSYTFKCAGIILLVIAAVIIAIFWEMVSIIYFMVNEYYLGIFTPFVAWAPFPILSFIGLKLIFCKN